MSRIQNENIFKEITSDIDAFCTSHSLIYGVFSISQNGKQLPDEYLVYDVISDDDPTYYSGKRTSTEYRVEFTYYFSMDDNSKIAGAPDELETLLIGAGYRPQGNIRTGLDAATKHYYWQKDYLIRERRI